MTGEPVGQVSLVIPGRNVAATIDACLEAITRLENRDLLSEIIFVDDGSTDDTAEVVAKYPAKMVVGPGQGAAVARNLGWQAASSPLIWFIDADCVAEPDALTWLLPHLGEPQVGAVGGSYGNMRSDSLLACLIHEEILQRHRKMPEEVGVLATYNVIYRRALLDELDGFDPACFWAHDAELAYRAHNSGCLLRFEPRSRVGHFHSTRFFSYLNKQRLQGYYRVLLYRRHPDRMTGDSYGTWLDYVQPPLAMLVLFSLPVVWWSWLGMVSVAGVGLLLLAQVSMTARIVRHTGQWRYVAFAPLSFLRAFYRGIGMILGLLQGFKRPTRGRQSWRPAKEG